MSRSFGNNVLDPYDGNISQLKDGENETIAGTTWLEAIRIFRVATSTETGSSNMTRIAINEPEDEGVTGSL